jgi:hypothetical protein
MKLIPSFSALALLLVLAAPSAWSAESDPIATEETAASSTADSSKWDAALKEKYSLTDQQLADLRAKGLTNPQIAIVSQMALSSGKTSDEILKMRLEQKMGWGKIAKELGLHPGEIGRSVSSIRHAWKDDGTGTELDARKERRRERREERRMERQSRKAGKAKGD